MEATVAKDANQERWLFLRVAPAAYARLSKRRAVPPITVDDVVPALDGSGRHFESMDDWSARIDDNPPGGRVPRSWASTCRPRSCTSIALACPYASGCPPISPAP
jgi:hypothetical protein